jgi:hypothetical protein
VQHIPAVTPASPEASQVWGLNINVDSDDMNVRSENQWIIDSGCTNHMTFSKKFFSEFTPKSGSVSIADDGKLKIAGIGTIPLCVPTRCGTTPNSNRTLTLHNVFYVPDIRKNLLSVSQAQRRGTKFEFTPTEGRANS